MSRLFLSSGIEGILSLFFPQQCAACHSSLLTGEKLICLHCQIQLPQTNLHQMRDNQLMELFAGRLPLTKATAFLYFTQTGMVQRLLHELKYKDNQALGVFLGNLFGQCLMENNWMEEIDAVVPVPLHRRKQHERGYNQTELLAGGLGEATGKPCLPRLVKRIKYTASQTKKSRLARWENVRDVFSIQEPPAPGMKHLLLIDDVLTTGATLEACGLAIMKQYPELQLSVATLAWARDI